MKKGGKRRKSHTLATQTGSILRSAGPKRNVSIRKRKGRRKVVNVIGKAIV